MPVALFDGRTGSKIAAIAGVLEPHPKIRRRIQTIRPCPVLPMR